MGFLTSLFGGETNYVTMVVALAIVLVLIVLAVWLIKLIGQASQRVGRGRNRRLAVIEAIAIDQKRQAVIIRRDGIEHLVLTGGPNDLVVESGFEAPAHAQIARPQRRMLAEGGKVDGKDAGLVTDATTAGSGRFNASGNGTRKSLRHTGLLRPVDDVEPKLDGGNAHNPGATLSDSAKNTPLGSPQSVEPEADTGDSDYAQKGKPHQ